MAVKTTKSVPLAQFKANTGISALDVFRSKAGNLYACDKSTGDFVGMLADDFDKSKPALVHYMADEETSDTWLFIANGEPKSVEFTL